MLNRVAVLSDVHGALPALEAVLADPDVTAADLIVLTGDIAAGPQPVEVLDVLSGLGDRVCWVGGNADRELVEARAGRPASIEVSNWAAGQLRDEEVVLVDSRLGRWAEVFEGLPAEVTTVVCGHTHMPFTRLVNRRLVVNPGSVGMPYGGAGAWWALLGPGVQLRRTAFDVDAACARVAAESTFPDAAAWADEYLRSQHSDADALAVFGPRDGR
ncbi:metallophosphoesterase family protein [Micromonospora sp. WMMD1120]|uniref:metallophosphoesterase family protein n=1 Tax=Micromonospora sp. WMMD1120 TaxID=3016106 RepID=UPI002415CEB0|nr:metallophosphoesterase family protein [Micromonospora sp. WMMD1120]MDG4806660.1 metallophosphoesterase family protein [Micromonospora sp. WMMD1120]